MRFQLLRWLVFFALFAQFELWGQQDFHFDESGYESVLQQSKKVDKPVFYMLYASWCPHCHKMLQNVFPDAEVAAFLQRNFVSAAQDVDKPGGKELAKKLNASSYPAFAILAGDGQLLYGFSGEATKQELLRELEYALIPARQIPTMKSVFYLDPADGAKCLPYVSTLRKAGQDTNEAAKAYFKAQPDPIPITELNWKILANGIDDIGSKEFRYIIGHQKEFARVASANRVEKKIKYAVTEALSYPADRADTAAYRKIRPKVAALGMRKTDSIAFRYDLRIYERANDWNSYEKSCLASTDNFARNDHRLLLEIASKLLDHVSSSQTLTSAVIWCMRSTDIEPSKEGFLITSKLYEKLKDIPKAIASAQKAKEFCKSSGFATKEADELLAKLQSE